MYSELVPFTGIQKRRVPFTVRAVISFISHRAVQHAQADHKETLQDIVLGSFAKLRKRKKIRGSRQDKHL